MTFKGDGPPFKRRIYARLRLVPDLIAANPSLSMQIGDRACCNCLNAIRKLPLETPTSEQEQEQACSSAQPGSSVPADEAIQSTSSEPTPADTEDSDAYGDFLAYIQCDPPTADCANGIYEECRGTQPLKVELEAIMEENGVKSVQ